MHRLFVLGGLLALAVMVSGLKAEDKEVKPKDIKEIMKKAHAGDDAFKSVVGKAIKDKELSKGADAMKAWLAIGSHLSEFDPPKGGKDSWKKETEKYTAELKALSKAISGKDEKAAGAAMKDIGDSCKSCHTAHRIPPKKKDKGK